MGSRALTAYPWHALEGVTRAGARRAASARRQVETAFDVQRLGSALAELLECDASIIVQRVTSSAPTRRPLTGMGFELDNGLLCALALEPELASAALGRVLRRPIALSNRNALDDSLSGALNALVLELVRRSGARGALHLLDPGEARTRASDLFVEATVLFAGTAYQVLAALHLPEPARSAEPRSLATLGALPIALPVVVGWSLAERSALADFLPGNAWFPGTGLWLSANGEGQIALAAPGQDCGIRGALSRDGKIVLRGESIPLLPDAGELMSDPAKPEPSLTDAVLDSPVVVRVEVGSVSLTAREWAELGPGDVIETGRRIAEPVVLRVAGREVARGELVNLEGELGVRIREIVRS